MPESSPQSFFSRELARHPYVVLAVAGAIAIAVGAVLFVKFAALPPEVGDIPNTQKTAQQTIFAQGAVEPTQNPNLSFETGGRVARVVVTVGDRVSVGETLASLDTSALSAQLTGAKANLASARAKLSSLEVGPRSTDIAVKQSAVNQAKQTLAVVYASLPTTLHDAYAKAHDTVKTKSDPVFSNPDTANPSLLFQSSNSTAANTVVDLRKQVGGDLASWADELVVLPETLTREEFTAALSSAHTHLALVRDFETELVNALNGAISTIAFPQSTILSSLTSVGGARDTVNSLLLALTNIEQSAKSDELAVVSAQNLLNQLTAGASTQDIQAASAAVDAAAAAVSSVEAQIGARLIRAPFTGTIAAVSVKAGDVIAPNTIGVTLIPDSGLEAVVYVSEVAVARITVGQRATLTLDAYGARRPFPATVATVDRAPTSHAGTSAYKVTLSFSEASPDIQLGMGVNASIAVE